MSVFSIICRRLVLLTVAGGILGGCVSVNRSTPAKAFLISEGGIGPIQLGMTVTEVAAKLGAGHRIQVPAVNPASESAAWHRVMDSKNQEIARFLVRDWRRASEASPLVQVRTSDIRFRTVNSIGPGSSVTGVQKNWGAASFQMAVAGQDGVPVRFDKQPDYLELVVRGMGTTPVEIYAPLKGEDFRQERTIRYWIAGAQISTVTVTKIERHVLVRSKRASSSVAVGAPLVNPPPMRARVSTLRLD